MKCDMILYVCLLVSLSQQLSYLVCSLGLVCQSLVSDFLYDVCQLFDARHDVKKRCQLWHRVILAFIIRCHVWHLFLTPFLASKSRCELYNQSLAKLRQTSESSFVNFASDCLRWLSGYVGLAKLVSLVPFGVDMA